jgi:hypothetical protein
MKERPIIMGAESVRAILEGRKTQTRRVVKPQPKFIGAPNVPFKTDDANPRGIIDCPYGKVGDRLWVRENWGVVSHTFDENENICDWKPNRPATPIQELKFGTGYYDGHVIYEADGGFEWNAGDDCSIETKSDWKSSMFMPRSASRITLEITDIRVERVQDITAKDATAEGVGRLFEIDVAFDGKFTDIPFNMEEGLAVHQFARLWDSINAKRGYPWDKNPWVWVLTFKVVQ